MRSGDFFKTNQDEELSNVLKKESLIGQYNKTTPPHPTNKRVEQRQLLTTEDNQVGLRPQHVPRDTVGTTAILYTTSISSVPSYSELCTKTLPRYFSIAFSFKYCSVKIMIIPSKLN